MSQPLTIDATTGLDFGEIAIPYGVGGIATYTLDMSGAVTAIGAGARAFPSSGAKAGLIKITGEPGKEITCTVGNAAFADPTHVSLTDIALWAGAQNAHSDTLASITGTLSTAVGEDLGGKLDISVGGILQVLAGATPSATDQTATLAVNVSYN